MKYNFIILSFLIFGSNIVFSQVDIDKYQARIERNSGWVNGEFLEDTQWYKPIMESNVEEIKALLAKGENPDKFFNTRFSWSGDGSPVGFALAALAYSMGPREKLVEILKALIKAVDIQYYKASFARSLEELVIRDDLANAKLILDIAKNHGINIVNQSLYPVLHKAIAQRHLNPEMVDLLIENGADVNKVSEVKTPRFYNNQIIGHTTSWKSPLDVLNSRENEFRSWDEDNAAANLGLSDKIGIKLGLVDKLKGSPVSVVREMLLNNRAQTADELAKELPQGTSWAVINRNQQD